MGRVIFAAILLVCGAFFSGIGLYALMSIKPMRFWSGKEAEEDEITDVKAYNRANGLMWISFSAVFWAGAVLGFLGSEAAGWVLAAGCLAGIPALIFVYGRIYGKYKKQ